MRIAAVDLFRVRLPLVRPFRTSFALEVDRDVLLVRVRTEAGADGWAECVATSWPGYSSEYVDACVPCCANTFCPRLWGPPTSSRPMRRCVRCAGHPMSKAALETAVLDAQLREEGRSLATYLGAVRTEVDCGVSVGIPPDDLPTGWARCSTRSGSTSTRAIAASS